MSNPYSPKSYFFVEQAVLADVNGTVNLATDGFGPVAGSLTTKYRTTSVVRTNTPLTTGKVFAVCKGNILIQPMSGDDTSKVNIILKPEGNPYAPLKIKYFIYRGVTKADLITSTGMIVPENPANNTQPKLIQQLWKSYAENGNPVPGTFSAVTIGFDSVKQDDGSLIETYFVQSRTNNENYRLPSCEQGQYIANFKGSIGMDIVLDFGEYHLESQEELFRLDLAYARKPQHIFDINDLVGATAPKIKRYREYIRQFIDPAAFWGSHMKCGKITFSTGLNVGDDIYTKILKKYQTQNNLYIYIQGENGRSYNYFNETRKVRGILWADPQVCKTNEWPVLIQTNGVPPNITEPNPNNEFKEELALLDYETAPRFIATNVIAPNSDTEMYPTVEKIVDTEEKFNKVTIQTVGLKSISSLIMIYCKIKQEVSSESYYEYLWPATVRSNMNIQADEFGSGTYHKSNLSDFSSVTREWAEIENKIFIDTGSNTSNASKRRLLFIAIIIQSTKKGVESLNPIPKINSNKGKNNISKNDYFKLIYESEDFSTFRGVFKEGAETLNFLNLFHTSSLIRKENYFHLGIVEEEYNILIYDDVAPGTQATQRLPLDADNVFFHLETDNLFADPFIRKFTLSLRYENSSGVLTVLPASPSGKVIHVYTCDGFYFFSKEYSEYQIFADKFPKSRVDFQVKEGYAGEFGFDYMREGTIRNPRMPGDIDYKANVGVLYTDATQTVKVTDENEYKGSFKALPEEYKKLELEYKAYFVQYASADEIEKYFIPSLTLYPPYIPGRGLDLDTQGIYGTNPPITVNRIAKLRLKIVNTVSPVGLELSYDKSLFNINTATLSLSKGTDYVDLTVTCLREFGIEQLIKVLGYYADEPSKKLTVGMLRVKPNAKSDRFAKNTVFVSVQTDIDVSPTYTIEKHALDLTKFLRQTLTSPVFKTETINLISPQDTVFNLKYIYTDPADPNKKSIIGSNRPPSPPEDSVMVYLNNKLKLQNHSGTSIPIGDSYNDYFIVFIFSAPGVSIKKDGTASGLGGISTGGTLLSYYNATDPATIAHEYLHTAGLNHSFTNHGTNTPNAKYTYNPLKTDNIMDYSAEFGSPKIPAVSIFEWQVKIVREEFNSEPGTK